MFDGAASKIGTVNMSNEIGLKAFMMAKIWESQDQKQNTDPGIE